MKAQPTKAMLLTEFTKQQAATVFNLVTSQYEQTVRPQVQRHLVEAQRRLDVASPARRQGR